MLGSGRRFGSPKARAGSYLYLVLLVGPPDGLPRAHANGEQTARALHVLRLWYSKNIIPCGGCANAALASGTPPRVDAGSRVKIETQ